MKKLKCKECGRIGYSATKPEWLREPACDKCGGELVVVEGWEENG